MLHLSSFVNFILIFVVSSKMFARFPFLLVVLLFSQVVTFESFNRLLAHIRTSTRAETWCVASCYQLGDAPLLSVRLLNFLRFEKLYQIKSVCVYFSQVLASAMYGSKVSPCNLFLAQH